MTLMQPQIEMDVPPDQIATVVEWPGHKWKKGETIVNRESLGRLEFSPFHQNISTKRLAHYFRDLGNAFLAIKGKELPLEHLVDALGQDGEAMKLSLTEPERRKFIERCVRACIAQKGYLVRKQKEQYLLRLSSSWAKREAERQFAAGLAAELKSLSDRMEQIVPHQGERGRFREDLLRALLERNLPRRYHVATGFIYGCSRQLDILIYDQVDYAPLFREEGVVVVPPESVRAVIEVKTTLNKDELKDALEKLSAVSVLDDCAPPFFKGVFAFRGPAKAATVTNYIKNFYQAPTDDAIKIANEECRPQIRALAPEWEIEGNVDDIEEQDNDDGVPADNSIMAPFQHLTCLCIDQKYIAELSLEKIGLGDEQIFVPAIIVRNSKTKLGPATALFVEALNQHLNVPTIKKRDTQLVSTMIGADLSTSPDEPLYEQHWGPYHGADLTSTVSSVTESIGRLKVAVQTWRETGIWND